MFDKIQETTHCKNLFFCLQISLHETKRGHNVICYSYNHEAIYCLVGTRFEIL
jgi:hypothetical protein